MPDTQESQAPPLGPDLATLKVWAEYAKERFKSVDARIGEYRATARQLVAAVGVVIGLEVTIVVRLALDERLPLDAMWRGLCLLVFVGVLTVQVWLLRRLLLIGYRGELVVGPESPSVLIGYLAEGDEAEAHRMTGAYYAKAHDRFHELSERLGENVAKASQILQRTLLALLVGVVLLAASALWPHVTSGTQGMMADEGQPASGSPAPEPSVPAPAQPAPQPSSTTNPLLTTPTDGQPLRKSESRRQVLRDDK